MLKRKQPRILVTGTGGGVGQSILKCLAGTPWFVCAADAEPTAVGLFAAKKGFLVPYAKDSRFIAELLRICQEERIDFIFPGLDAELLPLSEMAHEFHGANTVPIVSSLDIVRICDDKLATARFLQANGLPVPRTSCASEATDWPGSFPVVLKPKSGGCRSIGVYRANNKKELCNLLSRVNVVNYVIQEEIEGDEYTCGTVTIDGKCLGVILMKRELRAGDTYKAFVVRDRKLETFVKQVAEILNPFGPCNFQLRVRNGVPYIFEINARCSGTSAARALAGFNEPVLTVNALWFNRYERPRVRTLAILRHWQEFVVSPVQIQRLRKARRISRKVPVALGAKWDA